MSVDLFSLKNSFEKNTGLSYKDYTDIEKVWKKTKSYDGAGIVDPYDMEHIARILVEESKADNADDALLVFYAFADKTSEKDVSCKRDGHYGPVILEDEDHFDSYSMRTLVKGKGVCNQIAAEILGLCKGVGIPAKFKKYKRGHGYIDAWTNISDWIHLGYSEGIIAKPDSDIFHRFIEYSIRDIIKNSDTEYVLVKKIDRMLEKTSEDMQKYEFGDDSVYPIMISIIDKFIEDNYADNTLENPSIHFLKELCCDAETFLHHTDLIAPCGQLR